MNWLNANVVRVALYGLAAAISFLAWRIERNHVRYRDWWPTFWLLTCGVLAGMALGRLLDIDSLVTALGRDEAVARGLYENRRRVQAVVAGGIGIAWLLSVAIALWRVPERRRRYLPTAIAVFSMMCFAALRLVSLHQVDSLLRRRDVYEVRVGTLVEIVGVLATAALCVVMIVMTAREQGAGAVATLEPAVSGPCRRGRRTSG